MMVADAFTYVFGKDKPVFCMRSFGPLAIAAEHFLVLLFKHIPVYVIIGSSEREVVGIVSIHSF